MIEAGRLRHRVAIQSATEAQNDLGEVEKTWATTATVWGAVEPLTGRELWQAQQVSAEITHRVRMRYRSGLTPKNRILFGSRILEINAILNPEERNIDLELLCREKV